ncbi:prephenate dehydrogenase [Candidatus Venteria ishoeyi]|uniref:prephenate dehydrogenase n=1 Tax=Candidatus Venteria ishoeyi TaxID=1899563 RepID=A0A1H6FET1_9GAMM|nr:prephenate dehydrogenase/arogenate dehydrogenase family protein [Candidatus Venteria ishoeyi]SEH08527.1 T-protein [Candidatus Venteria ishoeyi]
MLFKRLCIIGVGLIGGSLARALRDANACEEVVGCGRQLDNLNKAVELGVIDRYSTDMVEAVKDADMVVLAVPLGTMASAMQKIAPVLPDDAIITDVGSAKGSVLQDAQHYLGKHQSRFVAGHPIAGSEQHGVIASVSSLFQQRRVILTPTPDTDTQALESVRQMWETTGAEVVDMNVQHHDEVLAATSHLPHMLAYALVDMLAHMETRREIFRFAAGGFRDFTRIASSDPKMWHDICLSNREELVNMLEAFGQQLHNLTQAIRESDSEKINTLFYNAKTARDEFTD